MAKVKTPPPPQQQPVKFIPKITQYKTGLFQNLKKKEKKNLYMSFKSYFKTEETTPSLATAPPAALWKQGTGRLAQLRARTPGALTGVHLQQEKGVSGRPSTNGEAPLLPLGRPARQGLTLALYASSCASNSSAEICCFELRPVPLPLPRLPPRAPLRVPPKPPDPRVLVIPPLLTLARRRGCSHLGPEDKPRPAPRKLPICPTHL